MGIGSEAKDSVSLETRIQVRADPGWKPVCTDTKVINSALDSYQFLLRQRLGNTPDQDCVDYRKKPLTQVKYRPKSALG